MFSILYRRFSFRSKANFFHFAADSQFAPEISGIDDVSTDVETYGELKGHRIVVNKSLVAMAEGPQNDVTETVDSQGRR